MHDVGIRLLSGYVCIILIKGFLQVKCNQCKIYNQELRVDCTGLQFDSVPQNLDSNIEHLDLSRCTFSNMPDSSFHKYNNLVTLSLEYAKATNTVHVDLEVFRPLTKLKTLNLEFSNLSDYPYFYWPPSLTVLRISGIGLLDLDVFHLPYLEQLNASLNGFEDFPIINKIAPLKYLNLDWNPIRRMSGERLAPFCQLTQLNLKLPTDSVILSKTRFCVCSRINIWNHRVKTKIQDLPCQPPTSDFKCDDEFSPDVLSVRTDCLERDLGISWLFKIFLIFVLILALLVGGKIAWQLYNNWKKAKARDDSAQKEAAGSITESTPKPL